MKKCLILACLALVGIVLGGCLVEKLQNLQAGFAEGRMNAVAANTADITALKAAKTVLISDLFITSTMSFYKKDQGKMVQTNAAVPCSSNEFIAFADAPGGVKAQDIQTPWDNLKEKKGLTGRDVVASLSNDAILGKILDKISNDEATQKILGKKGKLNAAEISELDAAINAAATDEENSSRMQYASGGIVARVNKALSSYYSGDYSKKLSEAYLQSELANIAAESCYSGPMSIAKTFADASNSDVSRKNFAVLVQKAGEATGKSYDLYARIFINVMVVDECGKGGEGHIPSDTLKDRCTNDPAIKERFKYPSVWVTLQVVDVKGELNKVVYSNASISPASSSTFPALTKPVAFSNMTENQKQAIAQMAITAVDEVLAKFTKVLADNQIANKTVDDVSNIDKDLNF